MWSFRKKDKSVLPDEVQEYYTQSRRERTWVAWGLAIVTMLVTIALALALFYGGRWIYRQIFDNDETNTTQTTDSNPPTEEATPQQPTPTPDTSTSNPSETTTPPTSTPGPTPTPAPTTPPATTTQTPLPNTGPDSDE